MWGGPPYRVCFVRLRKSRKLSDVSNTDSAPSSCKSKCKPLSPASDGSTCTPAPSCQTAPPPSTSAPVPAEPSQVETADSPEPEDGYLQEDSKEADESEASHVFCYCLPQLCMCWTCYVMFMFCPKVELSGLDHRFSSGKDDLLLCDDSVLPVRKIIGDRGGPASMKENVCQVRCPQAENIWSAAAPSVHTTKTC